MEHHFVVLRLTSDPARWGTGAGLVGLLGELDQDTSGALGVYKLDPAASGTRCRFGTQNIETCLPELRLITTHILGRQTEMMHAGPPLGNELRNR
jgi:hypothetical protein